MRKIAVGDMMTKNFVSVKPSDSLYKCAKIMAKEHLNSLIVSEGKKLLGFLTARDILWTITKDSRTNLKGINCIAIATKKVAIIKPSADISEALRKMREYNFRRLPVLSKGELIGVLTLKDILAIEPALYSEMRNLMDDIREEERKLKHIKDEWPQEGLCENCGAFSELLKVEGSLLCKDCREELY